MSLDMNNGKIRVYNYELSPVGFPSQHVQQGIFLRGRSDDEDFVVERVAYDDVEVENSKSDVFKIGRIRFHPDEEEEIYQKLGIDDRENIMSDKELIKFLSEDTIDNIKRISQLKSITLISRMKKMLFSMERSHNTPPHRISATIIERGNEIVSGGKRNPESEINKIIDAEKKHNEDSKLKETLSLMKNEIDNLKKDKEEEAREKDALIAKSQTAIEQLLKKVEELSKPQQPAKQQDNRQAGRPPKNG